MQAKVSQVANKLQGLKDCSEPNKHIQPTKRVLHFGELKVEIEMLK